MTGRGEPTLLWHAFPRGLLGADQGGADRTCRGSLRELIGWLPHLNSLSADGLLLGPVFASVSHGYDTVTHRTVDDRLGTVAELDALVAAASSHGIGVVLDGAFAYASRAFWRLADRAEPDDRGSRGMTTVHWCRGGSTRSSHRTTTPPVTSPTSRTS